MGFDLQNLSLPEVWGGVECTFNRVGDAYFDQLERSGHAHRIDDIDLFADLGIRALRYPILWERIAPGGLAAADWSWADDRLQRIAAAGVEPIVGLVHHGSGPSPAGLLDPEFPERLAQYARAVARRYPWVKRYTPVNEPLTTARFAGLYGHWHPHERDDRVFAQILINQCRAVALSMRAIREIVPDSRLIQNEDIGKTYSGSRLSYQADFENERRWLSFDLLCGRVGKRHPMWRYLTWLGVSEDELAFFEREPCPPDMIGVDYYVTSERFLDDRIELYPGAMVGGNGRESYVDVEAVRVCDDGIAGLESIIWEVWDRYCLPIAVTEAHLGSTTDEQMRWLWEMWDAVNKARWEGVDIRALTVWALLGNYDWDSLVTRGDGRYEPGVFAVYDNEPRPTELAGMVRALARKGMHYHPALHSPGWWRRPERLLYPALSRRGGQTRQSAACAAREDRK